ncbi:MAG TPA: acyl carrier protein [Kofleriaceae bacterium]|nr:acyl carrier protein [Kofleriaceae bacterium]
METAEISRQLSAYISQQFRGAPLGPDDPLLKGRVDSLGVFNVVSYIETTFGVNVSDEELTVENFSTVTTLARFIGQKLGQP